MKTILKLLPAMIAIQLLIGASLSAQGQWPPFTFSMTPVYEDGQITYTLNFESRLPHGAMTDLRINIPLPEGTRYVGGQAQESTTVTFDGQDVQFFTAMLDRRALNTASFVVEVTDPDQTVFTTQPWLSWQGQQPGDFLSRAVRVDITQPPLIWEERPVVKRLMLELNARSVDDTINYFIYTANLGGGRMWDVTIKFPLPEGTTLISTRAEPPFEATFDGREVTFKAFELEALKKLPPLRVKVSTTETTAETVVTHAWAFWKNEGRRVVKKLEAQEEIRTGDLVIHPYTNERALSDTIGDTPVDDYDLTSIAVQEAADGFRLYFYTVGELGPPGKRRFFFFYLNTDCGFDPQYKVIYNHFKGQGFLRQWNPETEAFELIAPVEGGQVGPRQVALYLPYDLFDDPDRVKQFCGGVAAINGEWPRKEFFDRTPNTLKDRRLSLKYRASDAEDIEETGGPFWQGIPTWGPTPTPTPVTTERVRVGGLEFNVEESEESRETEEDENEVAVIDTYRPNFTYDSDDRLSTLSEETLGEELSDAAAGDPAATSIQASTFVPAEATKAAPTPTLAEARVGTLAVPLDNGLGYYDIHIFSVSSGQQIDHIPNAHQPHFRYDGQRLLYSKEGEADSGVIYEYNPADDSHQRITDVGFNEYPFYDVWGNRLTYGNPLWAVGAPEFERHSDLSYVLDDRFLEIEIPNTPIVIQIPLKVRVGTDDRKPFIYVQCDLQRPSEKEEETPCHEIASRGKLVPAGWMGEIQGQFPIWAANDQIMFNACNSWSGFGQCGIYAVPSASTRGFSDGFMPTRLTEHSGDLPSDTKGNLIAFTSHRDGDWEAYVMQLDGDAERNISQSPGSNDGLPAISPDGNWVAFVSDREGQWAVWIAPADGTQAPVKLFDLPAEQPWAGDAERVWIKERISWGGAEQTEPLLWQPAPRPDYGALFKASQTSQPSQAPASIGTPAATVAPTPTATPGRPDAE